MNSFPPTSVFVMENAEDVPTDVPFTNDVCSYPFVYEFESSERLSSSKLPMLSQWTNCEVIYIVFQGCQQIGCAWHLEHNHYQELLQIIIDSAKLLFEKKRKKKMNIVCIGLTANYDDKNIFVKYFGHGVNIVPPGLLILTLEKTKAFSTDKSRQDESTDLGFCS